jgi:hypothetical protein
MMFVTRSRIVYPEDGLQWLLVLGVLVSNPPATMNSAVSWTDLTGLGIHRSIHPNLFICQIEWYSISCPFVFQHMGLSFLTSI